MTEEPASDALEQTTETREQPEPAEPSAPATQPLAAKPRGEGLTYIWGTGRRKTSVARVRIRSGEGKFLINKREVPEFFKVERDRAAVRKPLEVTETAEDFDVFVNVYGGGITGQAGAVMLGLARALVKADAAYGPKLREYHLLRRDPRKVERKKYGQPGARKRFQFSKR